MIDLKFLDLDEHGTEVDIAEIESKIGEGVNAIQANRLAEAFRVFADTAALIEMNFALRKDRTSSIQTTSYNQSCDQSSDSLLSETSSVFDLEYPDEEEPEENTNEVQLQFNGLSISNINGISLSGFLNNNNNFGKMGVHRINPAPQPPAPPRKAIDQGRITLLYSITVYNMGLCGLLENNYAEAEKHLTMALEVLLQPPEHLRVTISNNKSPLVVVTSPNSQYFAPATTATQNPFFHQEEHRCAVYSLLGVVTQKQKRYLESEGFFLMSVELRRLIGAKQDSSTYCNLSTIYLMHGIEAINKAKAVLHTMLTSKAVPPTERKRIREDSRETFKYAKSLLGLAKRYAKSTKTCMRPSGEDDHLLAGSKRNLISIENCLEDIRLSKSGRKDALSPTNMFQHPKEFVSMMQLPITAIKRAHRINRYKRDTNDMEYTR